MRPTGIALLALSALLATSGFAPYPQTNSRKHYESRGEIVWEVPMDEKLIALTFDDGPDPKTTERILDLLAKYEAKATFFVVGRRAERFPEIVRREALEGHEVANHTYTHMYFNGRNRLQDIASEMDRTGEKLTEISGQQPRWFRPPGGFYNETVIRMAKERGYTVILWSWHQDTRDWVAPGVGRIVRKVLTNARNGDIVLMHDHVEGSTQTVEALEQILPELSRRGYRMVTVSELMRHGKSNPVRLGNPH
ncbi:polysaccharide deacetylase family protein [Cohnella fermenti]|uniref:Polysaccharide deacetylase family protein n=1 Tax=Cohnella fermenti TaxID=2565925 RepID=A0A4V3WFE5_9BACL|nr:polysaccharide deacetylase family protein [Cohnella fermenti]THF79600.1 polysaccharide deacetylase family protein [Cohnella fermenti]